MKTKRISTARPGDLVLLGRTGNSYFAGSCHEEGDLIAAIINCGGVDERDYAVCTPYGDGEWISQSDISRTRVHEICILSKAKEMR